MTPPKPSLFDFCGYARNLSPAPVRTLMVRISRIVCQSFRTISLPSPLPHPLTQGRQAAAACEQVE